MTPVGETHDALLQLGRRLRAARLARNEPMALFAERLDISERTVRSMERGASTVQIGTWLNALQLLDHLSDVDRILEASQNPIEHAHSESAPTRQRASRLRR